MDVEHLYWMREVLVINAKGTDEIRMEVSYDDGRGRAPQFFRVPEADITQARALYQEWGGFRAPEYRRSTTAKGPGKPPSPSIKVWRENG